MRVGKMRLLTKPVDPARGVAWRKGLFYRPGTDHPVRIVVVCVFSRLALAFPVVLKVRTGRIAGERSLGVSEFTLLINVMTGSLSYPGRVCKTFEELLNAEIV